MNELLRLSRWVLPYKGRLLAAVSCSLIAVICFTVAAILVMPIIDEMRQSSFDSTTAVAASPSEVSGAPAAEEVGPVAAAADWAEATRKSIEVAIGIPRLKTWLADSPFTRLPLLIIALAFLKAVFGFIAEFQIRWVGTRLISDLRADMYDRILGKSVRFFSTHTTGQLMSRVLGDVGRLQRITAASFADAVRLVFTIIGFLFLVLLLSWSLALLCLIGLPVLVYPVVRLSRRLKKASTISQARAAEVSHLLSESITGQRIVKAFGMESFESKRFRNSLARMFRVDVRAIRSMALSPAIVELVGACYLASLLAWAGRLVQRGDLKVGALVSFLFGLAVIFVSVKKLSLMNNTVQQALGAAGRVFEVFDATIEVAEAQNPLELSPFRDKIELGDVGFRYEDQPVLDSVNLTIRSGGMVALVGPSGAGKSTLVNLLPRFYDVTEGAIRIDGVDIRQASLRSLRSQIALVSQDTVLFNDSVRNNIAYGNSSISMDKVRAAARAAHAAGFIEDMPSGYETVVGEKGSKLSAGQRQRLAIARAILKDAPILILDEATSALDAESEALVQDALETLMRGRTSIVIAHRLTTVRRADRIHVLHQGRVVESGKHAELLSLGGLYARLHRIQFRDEESVEIARDMRSV